MKFSAANIVALSKISESYARAHGLKSMLDLEIMEFVYKYPKSTRFDVMAGVSYSGPWSKIRSLSSFFIIEHEHLQTETGTSQYVVTLTEAGKRVVEGFEDYVKTTLLDGNFDWPELVE